MSQYLTTYCCFKTHPEIGLLSVSFYSFYCKPPILGDFFFCNYD
ncbi:protein of unknown function [Vibrio tapetis subsp. tapetis]|uniref:Uncharacterized protein n=1 Tax=Vibrio tapetis subsp. tapetis TaxID=1671868 RepID=A0A2N8ZKP1_9VIBR|nr:protein of unknown function [Vibrio tapetis subsp. tapetis]